MFVMHVAEELDVWPEGSERQRIWVSLNAWYDHCWSYACLFPAWSGWLWKMHASTGLFACGMKAITTDWPMFYS